MTKMKNQCGNRGNTYVKSVKSKQNNTSGGAMNRMNYNYGGGYMPNNNDRTSMSDYYVNYGDNSGGTAESVYTGNAPVLPETMESQLYIPGFLQTQIGKLMRVEFLVGSNMEDRVGVLRRVGASYIILQPVGETTLIMCDLFSIKFVSIINRPIDGNSMLIP